MTKVGNGKTAQERLDDCAHITKPANRLSHELLLCYRNCRYLERKWLFEPTMTVLARVIWADEDGAIDDLGIAEVLSAFNEIWDADEGCGSKDSEVKRAFDNLCEVAAAVTPHNLRYRDEDLEWEEVK
jgi:hypothetical protein